MSEPTQAALERHLEVETKLDAEPGFEMPSLDRDPAVHAAGVASMGEAVLHHLDAVYYDTDRLDLLGSRLTLRRRTGGSDAGWHLKLPAGMGARTEMRVPLQGTGSSDDEVPRALVDLVRGAARGRPLVPVARLVTRRRARHLRDVADRALVEVADDEVTGSGLLPGGPAERQWRELEVELELGTPEAVAATVAALLAAGAQPAGAASKVGRLLRTESASNTAVTSPPAAVDPAAVDQADSTSARVLPGGPVLVGFLARQRDLLIDADIRLRAGDPDPEAAHDARAAARRIRSVLRVYRPLLPGPDARSVAARLQGLGRSLSELRDLDVALQRVDHLGATGTTDMAGVTGQLAARRVAALSALREQLASGDYLALLRDLDALIADPPLARAGTCPADAVVAPLLATAWLELRADAEIALVATGSAGDSGAAPSGARASGVDDGALVHRVRKDAKTVRYAADAAGGAGGEFARAVLGFSAQVQRLQDVLGAHQDAVTAVALAASLATAPGLDRPALAAWAAAERAESRRSWAEFTTLWPGLPLLPSG